MTPPGIDPETVRPVAQCLNHYATTGPGWKGCVLSVRVKGGPCQNLCLCCNAVSVSVTVNVYVRKGLSSIMPKFLEEKRVFPQTLPTIIICHTNPTSSSVANHVPTHRSVVLLSVKSVLDGLTAMFVTTF